MKNPLSALSMRGAAAVAGTLLLIGGLAGCGGGDDDRPGVTEAVPASASANTAGFIAYLQELVVASADTLEPVDTSAVVPPTDDTGEPVAVN